MGKAFDQSKLDKSMLDWAAIRQTHLAIKSTTTTPDGKTLDWIPVESQSNVPIAAPPPPIARRVVIPEPTMQAKPFQFDIGEAGPAGYVPILRPDLSGVPQTMVLKDFLAKRGGLRANINRTNKKPTDPDPAGYFHATSSQWANVYGCDALLNVWDPQVGIPPSAGDDHSISQTWLQNYQTPLTQSVEAGLTVDQSLNGDLFNHLFIYYTTNGYKDDGNNIGGYNRLDTGWIQTHASIYPGIRIPASSVAGGAQVEIGMKYCLYQGNWWFGICYTDTDPWTWLGYYPGSLFNGGLSNYAQWVSFGGEVYSGLANPCNTADQMGSGMQAAGGYGHAAYQRNLHNQSDANGTLENYNGIPEVDAAAATCAVNPYSIACGMNSTTGWESYQYYGGPAAGPAVAGNPAPAGITAPGLPAR